MEQRPRVTVHDPGAPDGPVDVLGDEQPRSLRRPLLAAAVVLALLGGTSAVGEVRDRRAAAAQERRLQAVLDLELQLRVEPFLGTSFDAAARAAVLQRPVGLRNTGPRPVTVVSAAVDGLRALHGEQVVPAGGELVLDLQQRVPCSPKPPLERSGGPLQLQVRTGAGLRRVSLPLPEESRPGEDSARTACGHLPVEQAVLTTLVQATELDGEVAVEALLENVSVAPVRVLEVRAGSGLSFSLEDDDGLALTLPLPLPPRQPDGRTTSVPVRLVARVTDCAAVRTDVLRSFAEGALDTVTVRAGDDEVPQGLAGGSTSLVEDPTLLLELVARTCPGREEPAP